jgi:WD40 repeat protein
MESQARMENFDAVKDTLLVTSASGELHIRDGADVSLPLLGTKFAGGEYVLNVCFSLDNTKLLGVIGIVALGDNRVVVWDVASLKKITVLRLDSTPIHACFSSNRENELVTSDHAQINIWNYAERRILRTICNERYDTFSRTIVDEYRIISPSYGDDLLDRALRLWDYEFGQEIACMEFDVKISEITQCPMNCNEIAVGFSTGKVVLVDLAGSTVKFERTHHEEEITGIRYTTDGDRLIFGSCDGLVSVLDTTSGTVTVVNTGTNLLDVALCFGETYVVVATGFDLLIFCIGSAEKAMSLEGEDGSVICLANRSQIVLL